jgi:antitoxin CptB
LKWVVDKGSVAPDQSRLFDPLRGCILAAKFEEGPMVEQVELNRLFWHSRRGMLELDVLLVPFVKEVYAGLNQVDRDLYVRLLECEDQDMFGWFMERSESEDPELQRMVRMILDRVQPK